MEILPIQTGTVRIKPSQVRGSGRGDERLANIFKDPTWTPELPILAWAIKHPDGVILVDTGETSRAMEPDWYPVQHPYYEHLLRVNVTRDDDIERQLTANGIDARDVRTVLLTHLHTDHVGGLHALAHADIYVHATEYALARSDAGVALGYIPHRFPDWFTPRFYSFDAEAIGPFGPSHRVTRQGDVRVVQTPGHTAGHVSVVVAGDDVSHFIAGDATYAEDSLLDEAVDGISTDEEQALATIRAISAHLAGAATVYLPSHDLRSAARLRAGTVTRPRQRV